MMHHPGFTEPVRSVFSDACLGERGSDGSSAESGVLRSCTFVGRAADDETVHLGVVHFISKHLEQLLEVYGPDPKRHIAELLLSS